MGRTKLRDIKESVVKPSWEEAEKYWNICRSYGLRKCGVEAMADDFAAFAYECHYVRGWTTWVETLWLRFYKKESKYNHHELIEEIQEHEEPLDFWAPKELELTLTLKQRMLATLLKAGFKIKDIQKEFKFMCYQEKLPNPGRPSKEFLSGLYQILDIKVPL